MKEYIHHPDTVPLEINEVNQCFCEQCHEDSINGFSFSSPKRYPKGSALNIKLYIENEVFNAYGKVVDNRVINGVNEVFVDFSNEVDPFKIKMVQQVCQIIDYGEKKNIKNELAASQWVKENANVFEKGHYNKNQLFRASSRN